MPNQSVDWTPYLFLAAMIVAGGFVAWIADGLGRKIGKKRLSFMGLRPRYTATLLTVGAGVLIPILTIATILLTSRETLDWIREGRAAIRRAEESKQKADQEAKRATDLEQKNGRLERNILENTKKNQFLQKQVASFQKQAQNAGKKRQEAEAKTKLAQSKAASLQKLVASTNAQILAKKKEIAEKQAQQVKVRGELGKLQGTFNIASGQMRELNAQYIKLDTQNKDLEEKLGVLQKDLDNLQTQKTKYVAQISSYEQSVKTYQESIQDYTNQIAELSQRAESLKVDLQNSFIASRTRPLIFEASEELARVQLPPSLSPQAARAAYFDLLQRVRAVALAKKALNSAANPAAGLIMREVGKRVVSVEEQEATIIRQITAQRNELVLTARSEFNSFEGEYVVTEFFAYRNKLVYPQGKMIIESRIDGRGSLYEVLTQIQDFVSTNLRAKALRDGMIPPSGRNGQLGKIETEELLNLAAEIRSNNQPVRLQAMAKSDTNAGDQLEVYFRVRL